MSCMWKVLVWIWRFIWYLWSLRMAWWSYSSWRAWWRRMCKSDESQSGKRKL